MKVNFSWTCQPMSFSLFIEPLLKGLRDQGKNIGYRGSLGRTRSYDAWYEWVLAMGMNTDWG